MSCNRIGVAIVAAQLAGLSQAAAEVPSAAAGVDVAAYRDKLAVLSDGKGHFLALTSPAESDRVLFYGDGKIFFQVPLVGGSRNGDKWEHAFAEPRLTEGNRGEGSGYVGFDGAAYRVECGKRVTPLSLVKSVEAKALLDAAKFQRSPRKFRPHALARDTRGTYYLVDRGFHPEDRERYRVFVGQKGNLKQQKMLNLVSDPAGELFSTKTGTLRLLLNKEPQDLRWIQGKKDTVLTKVPLDINTMIASIYNDFGVYSGERLGTPCDDL